jgi:hypothetical protein
VGLEQLVMNLNVGTASTIETMYAFRYSPISKIVHEELSCILDGLLDLRRCDDVLAVWPLDAVLINT